VHHPQQVVAQERHHQRLGGLQRADDAVPGGEAAALQARGVAARAVLPGAEGERAALKGERGRLRARAEVVPEFL
jgi:hypothetical protein